MSFKIFTPSVLVAAAAISRAQCLCPCVASSGGGARCPYFQGPMQGCGSLLLCRCVQPVCNWADHHCKGEWIMLRGLETPGVLPTSGRWRPRLPPWPVEHPVFLVLLVVMSDVPADLGAFMTSATFTGCRHCLSCSGNCCSGGPYHGCLQNSHCNQGVVFCPSLQDLGGLPDPHSLPPHIPNARFPPICPLYHCVISRLSPPGGTLQWQLGVGVFHATVSLRSIQVVLRSGAHSFSRHTIFYGGWGQSVLSVTLWGTAS